MITRFDFDGNQSGHDNVTHAERLPLPAAVYAGVVAETADSYYLFYGVYHPKDYDSPLREFFFKSAAHDSDFEGLMCVVEKSTGRIRAMEGWFHNRFLQFADLPEMAGDQTIDGRLHREEGTHPIFFVQSGGHGVRAFQKIDEPRLREGRFQIYRLGETPSFPSVVDSPFVDYTLLSLSDFARYSCGPFDSDSMFSHPHDFGLGCPLGKYFSGPYGGTSSWARPKPPWSWTDRFDTLRPGAWFFHPAYVFNRHFGLGLSETYWRNFAGKEIAHVEPAFLDSWVAQKTPSYFDDIPKGPFHRPLRKLKNTLYRFSEYLFAVFG